MEMHYLFFIYLFIFFIFIFLNKLIDVNLFTG